MRQACCVLLLTLLGCGGDGLDRATVRGSVTVDGKPVESGSISLVPQTGTTGPSVGAEINAGNYELPREKGPVPGAYRVEIRASRKTGRQIVDDMRPPPDNLVDEIEQFIPPRYHSESILTMDVEPGVNEGKDYDLQIDVVP